MTQYEQRVSGGRRRDHLFLTSSSSRSHASTKFTKQWPNLSLMRKGSSCSITQASTQATNFSLEARSCYIRAWINLDGLALAPYVS